METVCLTFSEIVSSMKDQTKWNKCNAYKFGLREHSWKGASNVSLNLSAKFPYAPWNMYWGIKCAQ